jgi:hypothetical protein
VAKTGNPYGIPMSFRYLNPPELQQYKIIHVPMYFAIDHDMVDELMKNSSDGTRLKYSMESFGPFATVNQPSGVICIRADTEYGTYLMLKYPELPVY